MNKTARSFMWITLYPQMEKKPPSSIAKKITLDDGVIVYEFSDKSEIHDDIEENQIIILSPLS
jgi:hypothetical protein